MTSIYAMKLESLYDLWEQYEGEKRLRSFTDGSKFAIYGAGILGVRMAALLRDQFGTLPFAFVDQKAKEDVNFIDNIPMYSPSELFAVARDIPIGVAVKSYLTGEQTEKINSTLYSAGFTKVNNIWTYDAYKNEFIYINGLNRKKTISVIDILHDNASKDQYYSYIYSRIWKTQFFAPTYPASAGYCATDLFRLDKSDHVLDCGAYDGDSIRQLLDNFPGLRHITSFEPDRESFERLNALIQSIPDADIRAIPKAVSNVNEEIGFLSGKNIASHIDSSTKDKIVACRIDDLRFDVQPSFIKMDVEGGELDALQGAEKTIIKSRPILAICIYHKAVDIYEIPLYIKKLHPDYCLFARKNYPSYTTWDFLIFAVPPERLL